MPNFNSHDVFDSFPNLDDFELLERHVVYQHTRMIGLHIKKLDNYDLSDIYIKKEKSQKPS